MRLCLPYKRESLSRGKAGKLVLFVLFVLAIIIVLCKGPEILQQRDTSRTINRVLMAGDTKPVPLPEDTKAVIAELLRLSQLLSSKQTGTSSDLTVKLKSFLDEKGVLGQGDSALAHAYVLDGDYEKGLKEYAAAMGRSGTNIEIQASAHLGLGNIYYELALLDMINRHLYKQTELGFIVFNPDSRAQEVLKCAKKEFDVAIRITPQLGSKINTRIKQLSKYISGSLTDIAITKDQASAMMWLMAISKERSQPELMEIVKKNLDAYRWMWFLEQRIFISGGELTNNTRKQRFNQIDSMDTGLSFQLKGIYNIASLTATWVPIWGSYQRFLREKKSHAGGKEMLEDIGSKILECTSLLGLDLPQGVRSNLMLKDNNPQNCARIPASIEEQLEIHYSVECRRLFVLINIENQVISCFNNPAGLDIFAPMIPSLILTLREVARDADADLSIQRELWAIAQKAPDRATPAKVVAATDSVFYQILKNIKSNGLKIRKGD